MTALIERAGVASARRTGHFTALVVIGNPRVREAVSRSLRALGAREVLEAGSMAEARSRAGAGARELCVAESGLPDGSGIALIHELRRYGWNRGVVLSPADDPYTVRAALAAGVRCYLVSMGTSAAANPTRTPHAGIESMSAREVEVLQLVADGQSNKDIGTALGLSALTVKSHLARIARKVGTGDRAEMVLLALRAGAIV